MRSETDAPPRDEGGDETRPAAIDPRRGRARSAAAAVLIVLGVVLAPIAAVGAWAHERLIDTGSFVDTLAPLASEPAVQSFVSGEIMTAVEASLDIDSIVRELFVGIEELGLPPRSTAALGLLEAPAAEGVRSIMRSGVERAVESPQFAALWAAALRESHARAIAVIQGDPNALLQLSDDGALSLSLGLVVDGVRESLVDQGMRLATLIPAIDRSIPIVDSASLVQLRAGYGLAVALGAWLPWFSLGLLALGLGFAPARLRALARTALGLALAFLLLFVALGIARAAAIGELSPGIMPAETAGIVFDQLTRGISSSALLLAVVSVVLAFGAWLFAGPLARPARARKPRPEARLAP